MSDQPSPVQDLEVFNALNFLTSGASYKIGQDKLQFPIAQGTETVRNGIIHGDATFQISAYTGAGHLSGSYTSANITIDLNGRITSISNGGGGGGTVNNPMTSDLDGGGYDILNVGSYVGMDITVAEANMEEINNSAAVIYRNKGAVAAGNYYLVGEGLVMTDAEASCTVVSRCLDPGFKQTIVFHISMFNGKAHINLISNAVESDTPVFTLISAGDDGLGSGGFSLFCNHPSNTWEYRVYKNQDDKGTGSYPANGFFNFAVGGSVPVGPWTVTYADVETSAHASAAVSGSFLAKTSLTSATLQTGTANATVSLSTNRVNTNEIAENGGIGTVGFLNSINMNGSDIQSANTIGAQNFVAAILNSTIKVGHPVDGPIFVDTANRRVGINVPAPSEDLEIDGNIQLDSNGPNRIKFTNGPTGIERAEIDSENVGADGGRLLFVIKEDGGILTTRMTLEEDGRIGITNRIEGLPNPVAGTDAANKQYVDASIPSLAGYVQNPMTVDLDAASFAINNLPAPVLANDAATKAYVDASVPTGFVTNPMSALLDGGTFGITNAGQIATNNGLTAVQNIETIENVAAGNAFTSPIQAFAEFRLPEQTASNTGVMPLYRNGYLAPQRMGAQCVCGESVTSPNANKLNAVSPITFPSGSAYTLATTIAPSPNIIIQIPLALSEHVFSITVDGEWDGNTQGGNGNSYMYIRLDGVPTAPAYGFSTGQVVDGARYLTSLNYTGQLGAGDYCILIGHYDLAATRNYNGQFHIKYLGRF